MSKLYSVLLIPLLFMFAYSAPVMAAPPDFSICEGLSGAARGLCRAGVRVGCADGTGNPRACSRIESRFARVTGELPPWYTPAVVCPCDYATLVPATAASWSDEFGDPKLVALNCDADTASFQAVTPLPQLPVVNAGVTSQVPPQRICQGVPQTGTGEVAGELTAEELAVCRSDVLDYAVDFLAANAGWPWVDNCSSP